MAFVVGVVGVVVVGALAYEDHSKHSRHEDYSDYSDHSNYSAHSRYGDYSMTEAIDDKQREVDDLEYDVDNLRDSIDEEFRERVEELQNERYYSALEDSEPWDIVDNVRAEMREELENEIAQEKAELARIDEMIAKINELELQAKGT